MTLLILLAILDIFVFNNSFPKDVQAENANIEKKANEMRIVLQLFYLDGEVVEEIVTKQITDIDEICNEYKDWNLVDINGDEVVLKKNINDISPLLKANGYFGLSDDDTLSIFNGKPEEMNIIQSFFQIDIDKLESKKQEQLKNGIPIRSRNDYQKVLNAFKPYSRTGKH